MSEETKVPKDDLFGKRQSKELTPENAHFFRSAGNLISLRLTTDDSKSEEFERIVPVRAFPITEPGQYIAIREPDTREGGKGAEIGMIADLADFDENTRVLINEELSRRYFTPVIEKIFSVKEKFGYLYFDVKTSAGKVSFVMNNPSSNIRVLEDKRSLIYDIDGNCFEIPELDNFDKASYRKIEIYL